MENISEPIKKQKKPRQAVLDLCQPIITKIRRDIELGHLKSGDRLPSLRDFAAEHQVSFRVARSAFEMLEKSGILRCIQGSGTYVADRSSIRRAEQVTREVHLILQKNPYVTSSLTPLIVSELQEQGYITAVAIENDKKDKESQSLQRLEQIWTKTPPAAIIIEGGAQHIEAAIRRSARPATRVIATFCDPKSVCRGWHSVQPDLTAASYMAGTYLIEKGHRRIGLVLKKPKINPLDNHTDPRRWESNYTAIDGLNDAVEQAGLENVVSTFISEHSRYPDDTSELTPEELSTVRSAMAWLQTENRVTAVIGQEPWLWYVKLAANWLKMRIPDDLAVVGIGLANAAYRGEYPCVDWCCRKITNEIVKIVIADDEELGEVTRHIIVPPKWVDTKIWSATSNL